jgi:hypothetical protein
LNFSWQQSNLDLFCSESGEIESLNTTFEATKSSQNKKLQTQKASIQKTLKRASQTFSFLHHLHSTQTTFLINFFLAVQPNFARQFSLFSSLTRAQQQQENET